jgi:hypothetical protein
MEELKRAAAGGGKQLRKTEPRAAQPALLSNSGKGLAGALAMAMEQRRAAITSRTHDVYADQEVSDDEEGWSSDDD